MGGATPASSAAPQKPMRGTMVTGGGKMVVRAEADQASERVGTLTGRHTVRVLEAVKTKSGATRARVEARKPAPKGFLPAPPILGWVTAVTSEGDVKLAVVTEAEVVAQRAAAAAQQSAQKAADAARQAAQKAAAAAQQAAEAAQQAAKAAAAYGQADLPEMGPSELTPPWDDGKFK